MSRAPKRPTLSRLLINRCNHYDFRELAVNAYLREDWLAAMTNHFLALQAWDEATEQLKKLSETETQLLRATA